MPTTFDKLAKRCQKFGLSLIKREKFNHRDEVAAAQMEAKVSTGMDRSLRVEYAICSVRNGPVFFFSIKAINSYLKENGYLERKPQGKNPILPWKPLVHNDPPFFNVSSNWIRSTINLIRNSPDAGPKVLELLISIDNQLDSQAKKYQENRKN